MKLIKSMLIALVVLAGLTFAENANAQAIFAPQQSVALSMNVSESLTVSASPSLITFTYNGDGTATASGPISITTAWQLNASRQNVYLFAYPSTGAAEWLQNGSYFINGSEVYGSVNGGTPTPCVAVPNLMPVASGVCSTNSDGSLVTTPATAVGTRTDSLLLSMAGLPVLAPGNYSGTLIIAAMAQ